MRLSDKQLEEFKRICGGSLNGYSEQEIKKIASGVARFYLSLFKIQLRRQKDKKSVCREQF